MSRIFFKVHFEKSLGLGLIYLRSLAYPLMPQGGIKRAKINAIITYTCESICIYVKKVYIVFVYWYVLIIYVYIILALGRELSIHYDKDGRQFEENFECRASCAICICTSTSTHHDIKKPKFCQ